MSKPLYSTVQALKFIFDIWEGKPKRSASPPAEKIDCKSKSFVGDDDDIYGNRGLLTYTIMQARFERLPDEFKAVLLVLYDRQIIREHGKRKYSRRWVNALRYLTHTLINTEHLPKNKKYVRDLILLATGKRINLRVLAITHGISRSTAYRHADKVKHALFGNDTQEGLTLIALNKTSEIFEQFLYNPKPLLIKNNKK